MAETAERNSDEVKGTDCVFVADWLKTKGLHNILNCIYSYGRCVIRFIEVNCFDRSGVILYTGIKYIL